MSLLPNYNPFFAATLGTIYSRRWEPAPPYEGRQKLLSTPPIQNITFWHVQIRPRGEIYIPAQFVQEYLERASDVDPPTVGSSSSTLPELTILQNADGVTTLTGTGRNYGSIFKVRLTWKDGGGMLRSIDFDLGAGVDVITPPSHYVEAELLVPVPGTELALPPPIRDVRLGAALALEAKADCLMSGTTQRNLNVRFTDTIYWDPSLELGNELRIPRRRSTSRFQATSTRPMRPVFTTWDRNLPGLGVDVLGRVETGAFGPLPSSNLNTGRNDIPGGTNSFLYLIDGGEPAFTFSLMQELSY